MVMWYWMMYRYMSELMEGTISRCTSVHGMILSIRWCQGGLEERGVGEVDSMEVIIIR